MIQYLITVLLLLFIRAYYKLIQKPKKQLQWYKNKLQQLGYKVKMLPYKFLKSALFTQMMEQQNKNSDPMYNYKNQNFNYDIIIYNSGTTPVLQLQNPNLIKILFQSDNIQNHTKMKRITQNIKRSFGNGVLLSEGQQWKRKRSFMNSVFNYQFLIQNIPKISQLCDEGFQYMQKMCQKNGKMEVINSKKIFKTHIYDTFSNIFGNVILQCFFGTKSTHQTINGQPIQAFLIKLNIDVMKQNHEPIIQILGPKFAELGLRKKDREINQRIKQWRQVGTKLIKNRLAQLQKTQPRQNYQDIVEALVLKKKFDISNETAKKIKLTKQQADTYDINELIQQFCTFFAAGTESSSRFTQMMIYYISQRKDVQEKLRAQINEVIKSDSDITRENLKKLTYIDWIQNQTRRYFGPVTGIFTRVANKDHFIYNIPIKKDTALGISTLSTHYNEKYFKDPKVFKPERWQDSQIDINNLMGFGGGPRTCFGKHLALIQNKITIVKFMRKYKQFKLPKQEFQMCLKLAYAPETMDITFAAADSK